MQYKAIPILLKHAGWFSRKPKSLPELKSKPIWETDPTWKDDPDRVRDWYNGREGLYNQYVSSDPDDDKKYNRMDPEMFYSLLNKYKIDYGKDIDKHDFLVEDRKSIKKVLDLLKKKQKGGIGPEAYKFWMNRDPGLAYDDIYNYLYDHDWPFDLHDRPTILKDDSLQDELKKIIPYVDSEDYM